MLGNLALTSPTASSPSASATSIFDKLGEDVDKLKDKGENAIKEGINDIVDEFAELLGIHDFYSYHLLDYCEVIRFSLMFQIKCKNLLSDFITGLLYSFPHQQRDLTSKEKCHTLFQLDWSFPFRPYQYP